MTHRQQIVIKCTVAQVFGRLAAQRATISQTLTGESAVVSGPPREIKSNPILVITIDVAVVAKMFSLFVTRR